MMVCNITIDAFSTQRWCITLSLVHSQPPAWSAAAGVAQRGTQLHGAQQGAVTDDSDGIIIKPHAQ